MQATYYTNQNSPLTAVTNPRRFRTILQHAAVSCALAGMMLAQPMSMAAQPALSSSSHMAQALPSTGAPTQSQYFAPTGKNVGGDFLGTLQRYGVEQIGYPISAEVQEGGRTVQYFERVRMERHSELAAQGYGVLMTRLGVEMAGSIQSNRVAPFQSTDTKAYFAQTGHSLTNAFLSYWKQNGSVQLFGYPITEAVQQDGLIVQWFERARFEFHPELVSAGHAVELTHLGNMAYQKNGGTATNAVQVNQVTAPAAPVAAPAAQQSQQTQAVTLSGMESYMLKAINDQRAAAGVGPVQINSGVTRIARSRSTDMATRNYFSHTTPEGTKFLNMLNDQGIGYQFAGEILARNNYPEDQAAKVAMDSYLNSAPHKEIMLDGRFGKVGIGYAGSQDGVHYYTVIFVQD